MSTTLSRIKNAVRMLKTEGPGYTFRRARTRLLLYVRARLSEEFYEWRFGIRTRGKISLESLGIDDPDAVWYAPTSYAAFFSAMKHVPISGAFVDYGSGLGRTLIAAGTFPFNRVTGVELSQSLVRRSLENVAKARGTICQNIEVICTNAAHWHVTTDVTVFHFYNPFLNQTLHTVVENIAQSLREAPRQAWIVFANPWGMAPLMRSGEVIPHEWQKHTIDEIWPLHPVLKDDPDGARYRIYALDSRDTSVVQH
jgi:Putative methyltransferase